MTSSTNMRSLGDMPLELFQEILSYISRGDRKNLASTCKAYKEVLLEAIWAEDVAGPNDALFWGCKNGRLEIVEHAIARGAQVAGVRQPIKRVLYEYDRVSAIFSGHVIHDMTEHGMPFVKLLLKYGADVNNHKHDELTPLTAAARKMALNIMELLLEAGADPNKPDAREYTPYREATYHRDPQAAIDLLVKYGAVPDQASVESSLNR
ncbi:putative ankyrin repeat-containing protein [Phaeoacremonium minimum UCRPA7]|uniref:Putative ankyrin repeat-containing protein n=1 Tax=Phaeoacremonium minimum (strain UCR-PA7) TaxID=1286976 RepID=R8BSE6_PHAM7|nr:putative ankyrin repeat-containing protein [Phaeoacremonium minimum UCRPA7]EOO02287.1 putative ankyrin repeat-containing protein [Phaeoacremonium minimum UCRPA7]